ncbi:MAG TPA: hypothetical protein PKN33_08780 [Phycisphaerae bacterium]|nr:hypothetical protein [Phycisphaerae bacterium]
MALPPINKICPVMTEENVIPEFTTTFQRQVIGFCCDKCLAKFEANPSRYVARVAELSGAESQPSGMDQHLHEHGESPSAGVQEPGAESLNAHNGSAMESGEPGEEHKHDGHESLNDEPPAADHDHKHDHEHGPGFIGKLIAWLGKFHPLTVHFPIAMLLGTALAELLLIATRRPIFVNAGRFCLWIGCLGAVVSAVLGWYFGGFRLVDDSWILTTHRWLGTSTAALSVLLLVVAERTFRRTNASRTSYRTILFISAGLVGVTGFLGGSLIYGLNHYAWS